MGQKITIEFNGRSKGRQKFLSQIIDPISQLAGGRIHANSMVMFLREIVKNVYDHADGIGKLTLEETRSGIRFEVEDSGKAAYDFGSLKANPSSKAGNGVNYGVGLCIIESMAADLKIEDFQVDCSRGFRYSGLYPYDTCA